jgi:thymidylate kinase
LCGWLSFECSKVNRYVWPSGVVVAILGVDGVGKSTVINGILPVLNEATHNAVSCQHLRPGLLPPLARLKGKTAVPAAPVLDPHGATPSGTLGSLLRLSYLTLDYILGYWFKIRLIIAKQPTVVLYDRYAYDMVIDPRRFRIGVSGRLASLFTRLAPRPHLIICLHAEPEVVAARKEELPLNEIHRQIDALKQFAASQPGAVLVSTNGSPEIVRDRVLQAFMDFLSTRNQNI